MLTRFVTLITAFALILGLFAFASIAPNTAEDVPVVSALAPTEAEAHQTSCGGGPCAPYWRSWRWDYSSGYICDTYAHEYYVWQYQRYAWASSHDNVNFYLDHFHTFGQYRYYTGYWC